MKSFLVSLFVALSFMVVSADAAVLAPQDVRGDSLNTIDFVGAIPCNVDSSTGTNAVRCGSAARGIVYGVIASSMTSTQYIVLRDSGTANLTSSTATIVFANGSDANASGASTTLLFKFPVPMRFSNGISVNASASPTTASISNWTILYRPMSATE